MTLITNRPSPGTSLHPLLRWLLIFAFYLVVALIITWPLIVNLNSQLAGWTYGDAYETAHHMWWFKTALAQGESPFFASNLAYPDGIDGVTLWSNPLHFFPGWLLATVIPLPAAYNLQLLFTLALNGLAMAALSAWLLKTDISGNLPPPDARRLPAIFAGLIFMLYPTMQGHLGAGHAGLMVQWPLPLAAWALLRLRTHSGIRAILLAGACGALISAGHPLMTLYSLAPLAGVLLLNLLFTRQFRAALRVAVAAILGAAIHFLYLLPTLSAIFGTSTYVDEGGAVRYSADLLAPVTPSFLHPLFSAWEYTHRVLGVNIDEGAAYLGIVALLLAIIAVWKFRAARGWLLLAIIAFILSMGPLLKVFDQPVSFTSDGLTSYVTLPGALLGKLPGLSVARTPGRFNFLLAMAIAAMAGYGAAWLVGKWRRAGNIAIALLMLIVIFEYQTFWPLPTSPGVVPPAIIAISQRDDIRAVFNVPWNNLESAKSALYLQTGHEQALLAGQVTRATPVDPAKLTILETTMNPALLRDAGVDLLIVHRGQDDGALYARALENLGQPAYADENFAVFNVPETANTPQFQAVEMPIGAGERALYLYAPHPMRLDITGIASGVGNIRLSLNRQPANLFMVNGETALQAALPLSEGYHTVRFSAEPACPIHLPPASACAVEIHSIEAAPGDAFSLVPVTLAAPDMRDPAIRLEAAFMPQGAEAGGELVIPLFWSFLSAVGENDIRFLHLLDAEGALIAQQDIPLGLISAGEARADTAMLTLPDTLPEGDYQLSAGWYRYPEITPYCVLDDERCIGSETQIGVIAIGE
ncbi:MAG: hypothetical protein IAE89_04965 [Anaerolineae bacterium]|nr:hypothetical protein [Anaerolineae bacterium]